ncbi:hypothetical protein Tco_0868888 [Tanacetum coccineum]
MKAKKKQYQSEEKGWHKKKDKVKEKDSYMLESEEDSTMALELIRFIKKLIVELEPEDSDGNGRIFECWFQNHTTNGHQFTMFNRHKNWLVHKQTACGKDFSNPFMVDNLPKNCMVLNSPCFTIKSWLVQDQTVPSKDKSNLLIADSLLKTIWLSMHYAMAMKH